MTGSPICQTVMRQTQEVESGILDLLRYDRGALSPTNRSLDASMRGILTTRCAATSSPTMTIPSTL